MTIQSHTYDTLYVLLAAVNAVSRMMKTISVVSARVGRISLIAGSNTWYGLYLLQGTRLIGRLSEDPRRLLSNITFA